MANFNDILTSVCNRLNKNVTDPVVTTRIKQFINETIQENWDSFQWSFRFREYLLPEVTDLFSPTNGTVTATNGSNTVTADSAGTPFIVGTHDGAYIRFFNDAPNMFYRVITTVSTNQITIEPAYQGTSGSGKQFELKKLDWLFPSELTDVSHVLVPIYTQALPIYWNVEPPNVNRGIPQSAYIYRSEYIASTYSTGTVSGTVNTNTITGVGTSWLSNVTPGDTISITGDSTIVGSLSGLTRYTVYKVLSNTSIILYQNLLTSPATASYTSTKQWGMSIRLDPSPNQGWGVLVGGWRKNAPLINSLDQNELTYKFPTAIIEGTIWREQGASPDMREGSQYQVQMKAWDMAKASDRSITKHQSGSPIFSNRLPGTRI